MLHLPSLQCGKLQVRWCHCQPNVPHCEKWYILSSSNNKQYSKCLDLTSKFLCMLNFLKNIYNNWSGSSRTLQLCNAIVAHCCGSNYTIRSGHGRWSTDRWIINAPYKLVDGYILTFITLTQRKVVLSHKTDSKQVLQISAENQFFNGSVYVFTQKHGD